MDVFEVIESRRSIRKYRDEPVPEAVLARILEAGRLAPSASNRQPWAVVVVRDRERKRSAAAACNGVEYVATCAAFVVCIADPADPWCVVDAAIALDHMALTAWGSGVGSCWIGYFNEDFLRSVLHVPPNMKIVACLTLGYPDEAPQRRPRKNKADLVYWETFSTR